MHKFVIDGGYSLRGEVTIQGSKNAALPFIAASLLTSEPVVLENVPEIQDVFRMVALAEGVGAEVSWDKQYHHLRITARSLTSDTLDKELSRKLRGSILFSGALLGRLRRIRMPYPGGDAIGARSLGTHVRALESLGVISETAEGILLDGRAMQGGEVVLEEPSVTATENTMLAAVCVPGTTVIRLAAVEPHVQELTEFLKKMGADISWQGFGDIQINGVERLGGATHRLNPDELEVSSFATLAAATRSAVVLHDIEPAYLGAVFLQLKKMGVAFQVIGRSLVISKPAYGYKNFRVQSGLYPKLGSDHLPPFAVLATQAEGTSLIHDWLYEGRLKYLGELQKMGAHCTILDPHRALISGPTRLSGSDIDGFDIRSGMTLIIAALGADGRSVISGIEHIDRGYENLEERLQKLGARIKRISV